MENWGLVFTMHVIDISVGFVCLFYFVSFSRLFSSSSNATKKPEPPVNLKYNAPTSHVTPSVKKRSSTLSQLPGDKSKAFDFLSEE